MSTRATPKEEVKQYRCTLPAHGWAIENLWRGEPNGFYPLTSRYPAIYATRKEAASHCLCFEHPVRVEIRRRPSAGGKQARGRGKA